ncbi:MAG: quinonprotein alcohol dehydrogenase [Proteobacteria bacterium]|nr:quinonprotein alcohol dehydrogenase [Pseudomonadota bacterium]NBX85708.1 quinonprotein alcohol dehydrogenase [Pseudomonadota bacterium]
MPTKKSSKNSGPQGHPVSNRAAVTRGAEKHSPLTLASTLTPAQLKQKLHHLIESQGLFHRHQETTFSNRGTVFNWVFDTRALFMQQLAMDVITTLFWHHYRDKLPFQVGGMEVAAIPLVCAIQSKARELGIPLNAFLIRKERKTYSRMRAIEGEITNEPIVLVDDAINSGGSFEKCRVSINRDKPAGFTLAQVTHVFALISFESRRATQWLATHNIQLHRVFTLPDFNVTEASDSPPFTTRYSIAWRAMVKGGWPFHVVPKSAPVVVEDKVFMGTDSGSICAFNSTTGQPLWQHVITGAPERKGIWSTPAVHQGKVYIGGYNGVLYCLNAEDGKVLWQQAACEWIGSTPLIVPRHGMLYVGLEYARPRNPGSVAAFKLDTGERMWESWLRVIQHGSAAYYAGEDIVIFGTNEYTLSAYKPHNGQPVWQFSTRGAIKYAPAVDEIRGLVAAASFDGNIYLVNAKTGALVAEFQTGNQLYTTPLFHGDRLYCGSTDRKLYIINLTTLTVEKTIDCGARIFATPRFLAPNSILIGTAGGRMMEINATTLQTMGEVMVPDAITNAVASANNDQLIIIPTYLNELYAYHRQPLPTP